MRKLLLLFILITGYVHMFAQDRITGHNFATRSEVIAKKGMVCTSHPLATQIGLEILKKGGSAVDAAIAANAALGLMEPTGSGIGGDLFAIVWDAKNKKLYGLNASGRSPKNLKLEYFKEKGIKKIPSRGPLPVTVPGCVDGWFELHEKFGKLPVKSILKPAIEYAEEGFPVTEVIGHYFGKSVESMSKQFPNVKETYMPEGIPPQKGKLFRNPMLANTYKILARKGRDAFYKGEIAHTIADFIQSQGGFLSYDDLASHKSEWIEPVSVNYRGYDVWELPPNGQGIAALQMLQVLKNFDIASMGYGSADHVHYFLEAKKLAFEDRARYYADMNFAKVPVNELISEEYGKSRAMLIDPERAAKYDAGNITSGETIYLTTADSEGNMVSLIQSNYRGMGSGMVPPGLGFMLQDRGELFNLEEGYNNTYEPGKRPFHTIIPSFITEDGKPFISFGVMGGGFQPQGHVQIIMNIIDFGMNLQEAGDAPRIAHYGSPQPTGDAGTGKGEVYLESGFDYQVIRELMDRGHSIGFGIDNYGGYQAIMYDSKNGVYIGASESRKDGQAAGY